MEIIGKALEFEKRQINLRNHNDRIAASREAKALVLKINEIYKKTKDPKLMEIMKAITIKKRKIDKR